MHSSPSSPHILQLLSRRIDRDVIDYLISTTLETVGFALGHSNSRFSPPPPFLLLTLRVIRRSRIGTSVVLVALVYLERIRTRFRISDQRLACERILIGALVLASKYVSDYTIKNTRWARWSVIFSKEDIGQMERELLNILDWNLSIAEGDIMAHHEHLSPPLPPQSLPPPSLKRPPPQFQKGPSFGLEPSMFCPPPPPNNSAILTSRTRELTTSVTLPGFSSFLCDPRYHVPAPSQGSHRSSFPPLPPVASGEERAAKRPRLVMNPLGPLQPLSLENNQRHPMPGLLQPSADPQIFKSLGLSLTKAFEPFLPIPPVSFYES